MQDSVSALTGARTKLNQRRSQYSSQPLAAHPNVLHECTGAAHDALLRRVPPHIVYNVLRSIPIDEGTPTTGTQRQADTLFERIRQAPSYKRSKHDEKRLNWQQLVHAATVAIFVNGCVRYPRNRKHITHTMLQIIDCAVEAGLFVAYRSPPGSPKMSRLIPLSPLRGCVLRDPNTIDPQPGEARLVRLFTRGEEPVEIEFDPAHQIAAETQRRLELINAVNDAGRITCTPYDPWRLDFVGVRRLRPVHHARFTEHWGWHGRLYTGRYGHQSLRKIERRTIQFEGEPCIELDYCGMHTRLLYHRLGVDFPDDPYALWGSPTSEPQRLLAKTIMNATINARTLQAAVSACNGKTRLRTERGQWKQGKELEHARRLLDAQRETGLSFKAVQGLVMEFHRPIADFFGCDMGMQLMRTDSAIALDVLSHFAEQGVPALGVHDSFIVPKSHEDELRWAMTEFYRQRTGHLPVLK